MQILLLKHIETLSSIKHIPKKKKTLILCYVTFGRIMELKNICDGSENIYN